MSAFHIWQVRTMQQAVTRWWRDDGGGGEHVYLPPEGATTYG